MSLIDLFDRYRNRSGFSPAQKQAALKLENAMKVQGLPEGFSSEGVHIRRERPPGHAVFISNRADQMCMLNADCLEIYIVCPKCGNGGFKSAQIHSSRCDELLGA
jgi:hypothetical protein